MNNDLGTLSFGTAIDTSGYEQGIDKMEQQTSSLGESVASKTAKIREELNNIPKVNINMDIIANTSSLEEVNTLFEQIDDVVLQNQQGIAELTAKYDALGMECGKAYEEGNFDLSVNLAKEKKAVEQVINARKRAINEAEGYRKEVANVAENIRKEQAAVEKATAAQKKKEQSATSLRTRIRELTMEAAALRDAAQQEGMEIDKSTGRYREIIEELGRLKDIQGDIQGAGAIFANDENVLAGVMSGISGVTGAFTAAQGAVSLFAGENEDLQKVMVKVQSVMAITMGLQQVQQMLNKDSAFSLVTLNALKKTWNKLLAVGRGEQIAETAATAADTAVTGANATATEGAAVATETEAAAKAHKAAAAGGAAVAEGVDTAATGANAVAATAGTTANIGLAGAFRMVGAAIASIPVFGWIAAAIGVLIGVISHFVGKASEADEKMKEQDELLKQSREAYSKTKLELQGYITKIEHFNGTAKQEKQMVEQLNQEFGKELGYHKSLSEWKQVLSEKGEAYCRALEQEAVAQAYLNKYTEAYINLLEVQEKVKAGKYHHWYNTKRGDDKADREAIADAQADIDKYQAAYENAMQEAQQIRQNANIGGHIDPTTTSSKGAGSSSSGNKFDPKAAAREQAKIIETYKKQVKQLIGQAQTELTDFEISKSAEGLQRDLNNIRKNTEIKTKSWTDSIMKLAEARKQADHDYYMQGEGATEDKWEQSTLGQKSLKDYYAEVMAEQPVFQERLDAIIAEGEKQTADTRQKYYDQWVEQYGTTWQKAILLTKKETAILNSVPDEFKEAVIEQFDAMQAKLDSEQFKEAIDWQAVFGDMGAQSTEVLEYNLSKISKYFAANNDSMDVEQIKEYTQAMQQLSDEIASRNPFAALHQSFKNISKSKDALISALAEYKDTQDALTTAQDEYNAAKQEEQNVVERIDRGELTKESNEYKTAEQNLAVAEANLANAHKKSNRAEQGVLTARNNITIAYKSFASQLKAVGAVVGDIGGKAKNLAAVFSDDVAESIEQAIDFVDQVLDAASNVINAISDVGKSAAEGMSATVEAAGQGAKAASASAAASISTIEKASIILAVIGAALQLATAIAGLFNNDNQKQKEIERLQDRIDQLQWELDNADVVRVQNRVGKAVDNLKAAYNSAKEEVLKLHNITLSSLNAWQRHWAQARYSAEIYRGAVEKIADAYANMAYTADKALGKQKFADSRKQLENLAQQQLLIQQQIQKEDSKKKTDHGKIANWQRDIEEIAQKMGALINEMLEDIIGTTAEDLAKTLGDAFFEAAKQGEDAMEAWHDKVKEIVGDILQRMLITKYLEEPIGEIFDRYKKKWFPDGKYAGIDKVIGSMDQFSAELDGAISNFDEVWNGLSDGMKDILKGSGDREGVSRGIATASQDSVDENNARLTTIQTHTYTLVQGLGELNKATSAVLEHVIGIERNTSDTNDKLDAMGAVVKTIKNNVDDIATRGIKIKS